MHTLNSGLRPVVSMEPILFGNEIAWPADAVREQPTTEAFHQMIPKTRRGEQQRNSEGGASTNPMWSSSDAQFC